MAGKFDDWIFGCDICQEVCPWNRHSDKTTEPDFSPADGLLEMSKSDWIDLTEEVFRDYFKSSPVMRTGFEGLTRNIKFTGK